MKKKRKLRVGRLLILILIIAAIGFGAFWWIENNRMTIKLLGPEEYKIDIGSEYYEFGTEVFKKDEKFEAEVIADSTKVNTQELGTYKVKYRLAKKSKVKAERIVKVVDEEMPNIHLEGRSVSLPLGQKYIEPGYTAFDNYDGDITSKVEVKEEIDSSKKEIQRVIYTVKDSSGNTYTTHRKVYVGMPVPDEDFIFSDNAELKNQIQQMSFTNNGIEVIGHHDTQLKSLSLLNKDDKKIRRDSAVQQMGANQYKGVLDLNDLENGTYLLVSSDLNDEQIINELDMTIRLGRAKFGDKLVTFDYSDNKVALIVEDFKYEYDLYIESGHGALDTGSVNGIATEAEVNLMVTQYEKKRYEEHGLLVKIDRTTNKNLGEQLGNPDWSDIKRNMYAAGYYGSVSRFAYGNHHNSSESKTTNGWEILVNAALTKDELAEEHKIADDWDKVYSNISQRRRFYTRHFDTTVIYEKRQGQVYDFMDYYGMQRMPIQLFKTKYTTYESGYMSNPTEFNWYYTQENWKKISEVKIKHYVEACGKEYQPPK